MKTYLYPEVYGHKEITEWVPADVAREVFDSANSLRQWCLDHLPPELYDEADPLIESLWLALAKANAK